MIRSPFSLLICRLNLLLHLLSPGDASVFLLHLCVCVHIERMRMCAHLCVCAWARVCMGTSVPGRVPLSLPRGWTWAHECTRTHACVRPRGGHAPGRAGEGRPRPRSRSRGTAPAPARPRSIPPPFSLPQPHRATDRGGAGQGRIMTETTKTHVILLACGSFNPITKGHIQMFGQCPRRRGGPGRGGGAWGLHPGVGMGALAGGGRCRGAFRGAAPLPGTAAGPGAVRGWWC